MTSRAWHPKNSRFDDTLLRCITFSGRKSGVGHSRRFRDVTAMSALPSTATAKRTWLDDAKGQKAKSLGANP
jgi:hypothetical protein